MNSWRTIGLTRYRFQTGLSRGAGIGCRGARVAWCIAYWVATYLDFGAFASAFLFIAHLRRIRSAAAFLWAGENVRPLFFGVMLDTAEDAVAAALAGATAVIASGFFGGRPRRLTGPLSASIALFNLSRSAVSRARICSVAIDQIVAWARVLCRGFLRNSRKTECGAKQFLIRLEVRAAPFAH